MKKLILSLALLFLAGCGDNFFWDVNALAYVAGSNGHYNCVITQMGQGNKVYVGNFTSAAQADAYCVQVNALLKSVATPVAESRRTGDDGTAAAISGAVAAAQ